MLNIFQFRRKNIFCKIKHNFPHFLRREISFFLKTGRSHISPKTWNHTVDMRFKVFKNWPKPGTVWAPKWSLFVAKKRRKTGIFCVFFVKNMCFFLNSEKMITCVTHYGAYQNGRIDKMGYFGLQYLRKMPNILKLSKDTVLMIFLEPHNWCLLMVDCDSLRKCGSFARLFWTFFAKRHVYVDLWFHVKIFQIYPIVKHHISVGISDYGMFSVDIPPYIPNIPLQ